MSNQSGKVVLVLIFLLLVLGLAVYSFIPRLKESPLDEADRFSKTQDSPESVKNNKQYHSPDLKIVFEYPTSWFVYEKNYFLMITSYETKIGKNERPSDSQMEIDIHQPGGCHQTIDENLEDPACGEGGEKVKPNEIVSKEAEEINGAKFYKYLVKYPSGKKQRFYFLEKGDRVLQIDKSPDPSEFEKEFIELVRSIKFL